MYRYYCRSITAIDVTWLPLSKICCRQTFRRYGFTFEGCESMTGLNALILQRDFPNFIEISFKKDFSFLCHNFNLQTNEIKDEVHSKVFKKPC